MKANGAIAISWLALWTLAAPLPGNPDGNQPAPDIGSLIHLLSDENFRTREKATRDLWLLGESALQALRDTAKGKNPEAAMRARTLLRKIELHITPDTDPSIIDLVERFTKASAEEKSELFTEMRQKRAYRQMLKLFAEEKREDVQAQLRQQLEGVAIHGAREMLLRGDAASARELLELAPVDSQSLVALAAFHRGQGTIDAEIESARRSKAKGAVEWRTALFRAAGKLAQARESAVETNDKTLAAAIEMLEGNPLPWMEIAPSNRRMEEAYEAYLNCAARRWAGKPLRKEDLAVFDRLMQSRNESNRWMASSNLYLLGETEAAETAFIKTSPFDAFRHFETLERVPEALKALEIDPDKPDFTEWVKERFDAIIEDPDDSGNAEDELVTVANFLQRRGLLKELSAAYDSQLDRLLAEDQDLFTSFLSSLFGTAETGSGALAPSIRAGIAWAGDDEDKWEEVRIAAFGEEDELNEWWAWLAELKPEATKPERLDAMLAIFGYGTDPKKLRRQWLRLAWQAVDRAPVEKRPPLLRRILYTANSVGDVANTIKAAEQLPAEERQEYLRDEMLSAAGRWKDAADRFLGQIEAVSKSQARVRPELHAYAASSLRRAGREDEAKEQDRWVEQLALGDSTTAMRIAEGYRYGGDFDRAGIWLERAAIESQPGPELYGILQAYSKQLFRKGDYLRAASTAEALVHIYSGSDHSGTLPLALLRLRLLADLPRALHLLKSDRAAAIKILERCHSFFPNDGSLADDFFPSLRKVGLIKEHDAWFEDSWQKIQAAIELYPQSDNTRNTAGWIASRANRRLDEAEAHQREALTLNPDQPAYLDTLAEIHFAKGDRKQAISDSKRAINFEPDDEILREQYFRFLEGPFPDR